MADHEPTQPTSYEASRAECARLDARDRFIEHIPCEVSPGVRKVTSRLRADWRRLSTSDRLDDPVRKGERFVVASGAKTQVLTHWGAPFTGGNELTLPAGAVVVAQDDQNPNAPGFSCVPEEYDRVGALLVPEEDLRSEKYGGYSLSFVLDDIGTKLTPLP